MNSSFCAHQQGHLNGDNAPHPIEPRWRLLAALLLLAARSPRRRLAGLSQARGLPSSRCPGVRRHTRSCSARLAGRSQARSLPSSRCPGVRRHTWSRSAQPCPRTLSQATRARPTGASRSHLVTNLEGGPMTGSLCVTAGQGSTSSTISALRNRSTRTWPRPLAGVNTPPPGGSRWPP